MFMLVHQSSTFRNPLELTDSTSQSFTSAKLSSALDKVSPFSGIFKLVLPPSNFTLRAEGTQCMQDGLWYNFVRDVKAAAAQ